METIIPSKKVKRSHVREALVASGLLNEPPKLDDFRFNESLNVYSLTIEAASLDEQLRLRRGSESIRKELRVTEVMVPNMYVPGSYPVRILIAP